MGPHNPHTPHAGARFELVRLSVNDGGVCYAARIHLPAARFDHLLSIALPGGACALTDTGCEPADAAPAPWARVYLLALARQVYREVSRDQAIDWPRRLLRWREPHPAADRGLE